MKMVKLLVSRAGVGFSQNRGDVVEVSDGEALRMVEAGQCDLVEAPKERAVASKPSTTRASKG